MSQTLVIHNDKALIELLNLNLPIYVGTDVIFKHSFKESRVLIEHHPGIHLIICAAAIGTERTAEEILKYNQSQNKNTPMIVLGDKTKVVESPQLAIIHEISLKPMLQAAAKFLKVTPKKMIEQVVPDFIPIAMTYCLNMTKSPCDLFILKDDQYQKIHSINDSVDAEEIQKLIKNKTDTVYVEAANRLKFVNHVTTSLVSRLNDPNMSQEEKLTATDEAMQMVQQSSQHDGPPSPSTVELTTAAINTCLEIAKNNPTVAGLIKKLMANKASYMYKHTQLITHISQHILSNIEWGSNEQKSKLAFVAFFHDICLTSDKLAKIHSDIAVGTSNLSMLDKDLVFKHAKVSAEIVQKFPVAPIGTDIIIMQHHGAVNGLGFAKTFTNSISPLAIVFIVAEEFTNMILQFPEDEKISSHKDDIIDKLNQKFNRSKYQKIIETLETINFE